MMGAFLMRGMLCGIVAGLLAFFYAHFIGEPEVGRAIALETQRRIASGMPPEAEIVSRSVQSGAGLFTAIAAAGVALGGLFSLACAAAHARIGSLGDRAVAALLAGAAFVALALVPSLKYPANPPSVGIPETIGLRTELYFSMIGLSLGTMVLATILAIACARRFGRWNAALIGGGAYIFGIALMQHLLPSVNEIPVGFPADLLWRFRVASLGTHAVLWSTLGVMFGYLSERSKTPRPTTSEARS